MCACHLHEIIVVQCYTCLCTAIINRMMIVRLMMKILIWRKMLTVLVGHHVIVMVKVILRLQALLLVLLN